MYPLMEFPRERRDQVEMGVARLTGGMLLQLVLGRHSANPKVAQVRVLQVCADGLHDVYAILTSGSEDVSAHLGPWQVALASREALPPAALRAVIESGLLQPTARVAGLKRLPVWTINAAALTPEARAHACRMFGWLTPHAPLQAAANDEGADPEGSGQRDHNQERDRQRAGECA